MNSNPFVSVVMSVYNGGEFLKDAINSILSQSYKNFEFIIINDGSSDNFSEILELYDDERIKVLNNQENKGLVYSLNRGLLESIGKYIVRMDADDISLPNRIEKQVEFMEREPEVGVCGSYIEIFGDTIKRKVQRFPSNVNVNEAFLLFSTCLAHPSVIIRKSIVDKYKLRYDDRYLHAEDYAIWCQAVKYTKISNIREVLLKYRILESSVTRQANKNFQSRFDVHKSIYKDIFRNNGIDYTEKELYLHFIISDNNRFRNQALTIRPSEINAHLTKILSHYRGASNYKYIAFLVNKRGLSLSRWYSESRGFYFIMYLFKFLYYKIQIKK